MIDQGHVNLEEFVSMLNAYVEAGHGKRPVVVRTHDQQIGFTSSVPVQGTSLGIDCDDGKFFIHPVRKLISMPEK